MEDSYGKKVRERRKELGISQTQLAEKLGVTQSVVSNWEMGRTRINTNILEKLCSALLIDIDDFLEIDKIPLKTLSIDELVIPDTDDITRRYYELDDHGREIVKMVLDKEYKRIKETKNSYATIYPMFDANINDQFIVGKVDIDYYPQAAGMGSGQDVEITFPEKLELDETEIPKHTDFIIRVVGDSMEPTYYSGDKLFVQKTKELRPGDIGVFNLNGEAMVKEYGSGELISHNKKYKPIKDLEGCYIQGKILGRVRNE